MAVAWLYGCRPMEEADEDAACIALYEGAYAWLLANVQPVPLIHCKGRPRPVDHRLTTCCGCCRACSLQQESKGVSEYIG